MVTFFSVEPITGATFGAGWDCVQAPIGRAPERPGVRVPTIPDGYVCEECGSAVTHRGTCSRSAMRGGGTALADIVGRMETVDGPEREA